MHVILRIAVGAGLFAFGYYLGKQVGMLEPIRSDLARARKRAEEGESASTEFHRKADHGPGD